MQEEQQSPKGALNRTDWKKIGIQGSMVVAASVATWIIQVSTSIDLGPTWTPIVVSALAVLANVLRKWGTGPGK